MLKHRVCDNTDRRIAMGVLTPEVIELALAVVLHPLKNCLSAYQAHCRVKSRGFGPSLRTTPVFEGEVVQCHYK